MRIFITGGTGIIGKRLIDSLLQRGDEVVLLTRRVVGIPGRERLMLLIGDPTVAGPWMDTLQACDAVVHLAGEPILGGRWTTKFKQKLLESRTIGTGLVAQAVAQSPKPLIVASAIGYYGADAPEERTETSPPGTDFLANVCVAWERAADPAREAGARVVHVRVGIVLDLAGGALPKLVRPFRFFVGGRIASGKQWMSWIHRDDLTALFLFALNRNDIAGPINAVAPEPVTNWGFTKLLGTVLGRPSVVPVPAFAVRLLLGEAAVLVTQGQRVRPDRALSAGYEFRFAEPAMALRDLLRPAS